MKRRKGTQKESFCNRAFRKNTPVDARKSVTFVSIFTPGSLLCSFTQKHNNHQPCQLWLWNINRFAFYPSKPHWHYLMYTSITKVLYTIQNEIHKITLYCNTIHNIMFNNLWTLHENLYTQIQFLLLYT